MKASWKKLRNALWSDRPLRQKLAIGVWLSVLPISLLTSLIALQQARREVLSRLSDQMSRDATLVNAWLGNWEQIHINSMKLAARLPDIQELKPETEPDSLDYYQRLHPVFSYAITKKDGTTPITSGTLLKPLPQNSREPNHNNTTTIAKALRGIPSNAPLTPPYSTSPCMASSVPIYTADSNNQAVTGALTSCIPMSLIGQETNVDTLMRLSAEDNGGNVSAIDLEADKSKGYGLITVLPDQGGTLILSHPDKDVNQTNNSRNPFLGPEQYSKSAWAPLIKLAQNPTSPNGLQSIRINGIKYYFYVGLERSRNGRSTLAVIDEDTALWTVNKFFGLNLIGQFISLILSSAVVYRICKTLSKPIDQAGATLSRISRGEFGDPLPCDNSDIGRLFSYVNQASDQLKAYIASEKEHASTDAQLKEAHRIQDSFLIKNLPSSPEVELAASFEPALQIGADWYDALKINSITYVVVADVCDKGIPSALYMSVFRSLLRMNLIKEAQEGENSPGEIISRSVSAVNRYMAETHGETAMFATGFIAAYDPQEHTLHYVLAGHEQPIVLQGSQQEELLLSGPAVGLFSEASFQPHHCTLSPDSILLAYSDGLPDARDPNGNSFGHQRITTILREKRSTDWAAESLVHRFQIAVKAHMDSAEQFDDLTLLSLKVRA